jgi:hypothetical protein
MEGLPMAKDMPILTNFTSGELSPRVSARVDLAKYFNGCRILQNFITLPHGGAIKRPGTYFVAEAKYSDKKCRLVPFEFSTTQAYVLEFGDKYIRVYKDSGQVVNTYGAWAASYAYELGDLVTESSAYYRCLVAHTSGTFATDLAAGKWEETDGADDLAYEIPTTYLEAELPALQFAQSADTLYIVHPSHKPAKLTRTGHTDWTLTDITFTAGSGEENFSAADHYPACIAIYEERLALAATNTDPQTFWMSQSGDWENFTQGAEDADAITYTVAADRVNVIRWLVSQDVLCMGTTGGEWIIRSSSSGEPITATNINVKRHSTRGSKNLQALLVNDCVLFVQRAGKKVREFVYNYEKDGYVAPDLSLLANHITTGGINYADYQQEPDSILWSVRGDGVLLGMTYLRDQDVIGWYRIVTDGEIESNAIITTEDEDQVWISVMREVNEETKRYIEYFMPHAWDGQTDYFFVDSGLSYEGESTTITGYSDDDPCVVIMASNPFDDDDRVKFSGITDSGTGATLNSMTCIVKNGDGTSFELYDLEGNAIDGADLKTYVSGGAVQEVIKAVTGLSHLIGKTVDICTDGAEHPQETVSETGTVTLDWYANVVHVGLHYESILETMDLDLAMLYGTSQGRVKRLHEVVIRFYETLGGWCGPDADNLEQIGFRTAADDMGAPPPVFTGDKVVSFPGDYERDARVYIKHDQPLPCSILAIMPHGEGYE